MDNLRHEIKHKTKQYMKMKSKYKIMQVA